MSDRDDFSFFHSLRVRWSEVDMQAVVFNGHYLTYFDVAFTEYWRQTGLPDVLQQAREGRELFARKATIDYQGPARFDDVLQIGVRCAGLGRSSMRFALAIYVGDTLIITGELVYVYADTTVRKGVPIPDHWRAAMTGLEKIPPVAL